MNPTIGFFFGDMLEHALNRVPMETRYCYEGVAYPEETLLVYPQETR